MDSEADDFRFLLVNSAFSPVEFSFCLLFFFVQNDLKSPKTSSDSEGSSSKNSRAPLRPSGAGNQAEADKGTKHTVYILRPVLRFSVEIYRIGPYIELNLSLTASSMMTSACFANAKS